MIPAFYSTLVPSNKDNTFLWSIIRSFELQVLPSDITQITETPNDGILCRAGERWWEELSATKEEVAEVLTGKRSMQETFKPLTSWFLLGLYIQLSNTLCYPRVATQMSWWKWIRGDVLPYDEKKNQLGKVDSGLHPGCYKCWEEKACHHSIWHIPYLGVYQGPTTTG